jgi:hypothetical protein
LVDSIGLKHCAVPASGWSKSTVRVGAGRGAQCGMVRDGETSQADGRDRPKNSGYRRDPVSAREF